MVNYLPQEQESAREPDDEANEDEREEGEERKYSLDGPLFCILNHLYLLIISLHS